MSGFWPLLVLFLALFWGIAYAIALERISFMRWLVDKRTWIVVVAGVGMDLILIKLIIPWEWWVWMAIVVALSAVGIIGRSLYLEHEEWMELLGGEHFRERSGNEPGREG